MGPGMNDGMPNRERAVRYEAYAKAHGRSYDEQLEWDRREYPGGMMAGYIVWNSQRMRDFLAARPDVKREMMSEKDHDDFTAFLRGGT